MTRIADIPVKFLELRGLDGVASALTCAKTTGFTFHPKHVNFAVCLLANSDMWKEVVAKPDCHCD